MLKILLKIWPAFTPIMVYIFWIYVIEKFVLGYFFKKDKVIEGEKLVGEKATKNSENIGKFSLKNRCFVTIIYMTLSLLILSMISLAFS
jgi:hypothetical protein